MQTTRKVLASAFIVSLLLLGLVQMVAGFTKPRYGEAKGVGEIKTSNNGRSYFAFDVKWEGGDPGPKGVFFYTDPKARLIVFSNDITYFKIRRSE